MKNITLKANEQWIIKARLKAKREKRSLADLFNYGLKLYITPFYHHRNYNNIMKKFSYLDFRRKLTRDEINKR
ncbi:MAG: antitoxin [Spirochaetia bacterium]|nr:antitoxin [Spirochaetia bacterium]